MKSKLKKRGLFLFLLFFNVVLATDLGAGCPPDYDEVCATEITKPGGGTTLNCGTNGDDICCVLKKNPQ